MTSAIEQLYRTYFPLIREKCRRMLSDPDDAQDVAQETLIRLWERGPSSLDAVQATVWIYRTSTRLAVDRLRQRKVAGVLGRTKDDVGPELLEQSFASRQMLERIARFVPRRELEVAMLHRIDGLGQLELSEATNQSERTVRRLLSRFDERLKRLSEDVP
jgi:RNA polymerase sigma-70 factor, ECF subfamily